MRILFSFTLLFTVVSCGGGSGRPTGPPTPVLNTIRTVTGQISFFTTGPVLNVGASGRLLPQAGFVLPTFPRPAPNLPVDILASSGLLMGQGITDAAGRFSVDIDFGPGAPATQVRIRIRAQLDLPFGTTVRVLPDDFSTEPYSHVSFLGGDPDEKTMTIDLTIALNDSAGAYHILDALHDGILAAKSGIQADFPPLDIIWSPGNGDQSTLDAGAARATLTIAGGIAGDPASNQDAWDPPQLMRLFGQYLLAYFINDVAPDGPATDGLLVPSAAWREGFLDFWACIGRGSTVFWDTEGIGDDGRVIRYFDIESFFGSALGTLGPDDPNVYEDAAVVGLGSAQTVAEMLWDIHDDPLTNDDDNFPTFPLFLTLRALETLNPGQSYPYLFTLFDRYVADDSLDAVTLDILTRFPEDQGLVYPGTVDNDLLWPPPVSPTGAAVFPPFDRTISDTVDTQTPPVNVATGFLSQRYYLLDPATPVDLTLTLLTTGDLVVELLDLANNVLASGTTDIAVQDLPSDRLVIRVRPASAQPQIAAFDLRVVLDPP